MNQSKEDNEGLPCSEVIAIIANSRVYKTTKWWMEAVGGEMFNKRKAFIYLWMKDKDGKWKRKGKLTIGSKQNWEDIKKAGDEIVDRMF